MGEITRKGLAALLVGAGLWAVKRSWQRSRNRIRFQNRTVLITGGSRGLGLVMARQLAVEGARVIPCARDADELQKAADELRQSSSTVDWRVPRQRHPSCLALNKTPPQETTSCKSPNSKAPRSGSMSRDPVSPL